MLPNCLNRIYKILMSVLTYDVFNLTYSIQAKNKHFTIKTIRKDLSLSYTSYLSCSDNYAAIELTNKNICNF